MAITLDKGYDATGNVATTKPVVTYLYPAVFARKDVAAGSSSLTNLSSPTDRPESVKVAVQDVDVYKGTTVTEGFRSPSSAGRQLLVQINEIWSKVDAAVPSYRQDLPIQGHIVLKVPSDAIISVSDIEGLVARLIGQLYQSDDAAGTTITCRIGEMLRGAVTPSGL